MTPVDWDEPDPDEYPGDFYDDEGLESDTLSCPTCGREVYEDAEQCPACGTYMTHRSQLSPLWRWTAVVLLACLVYWVWSTLRNLP